MTAAPANSFSVIIPARLASTRLPNKPLADLGGTPMVVRVAHQAMKSAAASVVVAADSPEIVDTCTAFGVQALLTRADHASGTDRLAEAVSLLGLGVEAVVVNVQGDEPLIDPVLIDAVAALLASRPDCAMSTAACALTALADWLSPNVVKVVLDAQQTALYFSRAPIPFGRDSAAAQGWSPAALRHIGIYAYRAGFLKRFPLLASCDLEQIECLEQLRALWHGHKIAVHVSATSPGMGVDTPEDLARVREDLRAILKNGTQS